MSTENTEEHLASILRNCAKHLSYDADYWQGRSRYYLGAAADQLETLQAYNEKLRAQLQLSRAGRGPLPCAENPPLVGGGQGREPMDIGAPCKRPLALVALWLLSAAVTACAFACLWIACSWVAA
jgi:hypothetical protein